MTDIFFSNSQISIELEIQICEAHTQITVNGEK